MKNANKKGEKVAKENNESTKFEILDRLDDISKLLADCPSKENSYLGQYEAFIKYPEQLCKISKHEFYIIYGYVYAWMPRQQSFTDKDIIKEENLKGMGDNALIESLNPDKDIIGNDNVGFLSKFLTKNIEKNQDINSLINIINESKKDLIELNEKLFEGPNSIVGLTKMLHFINPEIFPIFDKRVAEEYCDSKITWDNYFRFKEEIDNWQGEKEAVIDNVKKILGVGGNYRVTFYRAIDVILYNWNKYSIDLSFYEDEVKKNAKEMKDKDNKYIIKTFKFNTDKSNTIPEYLYFQNISEAKFDDFIRKLKITKGEYNWNPRKNEKKEKKNQMISKKTQALKNVLSGSI